MRILFISPWDRRRQRYRSPLSFLISYPPLTLPMLAALTPDGLDAQIAVYDEIFEKKPPDGPFDVVGITAISSESVRAYELADHYRAKGCFVVLGGYHVTFMPEEALEHADALVTGEALHAWPQLLRDLAEGVQMKSIYHGEGEQLAKWPIPQRGILKSRAYAPVETVIASNGCPNNCSFCSIRTMARHSTRPVEEVIFELSSLRRRFFIFYDPNFFANRSYALELMKAMEPLKLRWGATATVDIGFDEELLDAAQKAGCNGVLIGFESLSQAALEGARKKHHDPAVYRQAVENIHRYRMTINGTFVIGLDEETAEDLTALPERVRTLGIDLPVYFILTPTPGSALYHEMKAQGRILTEDWSRYSQADVVFKPQNMTPEQLLTLYQHAWKETYTLPNILRRVLRAPGASLLQKIVVLSMNIGFKFMGQDKGEA